MVHEVAIDPGEMKSFDRVARFMNACCMGSPRVIAHFPHGSWRKSALAAGASAGCGDAALKSIEIAIDTAFKSGRFINRGRPSNIASSWISAAIQEHTRLPFRAIVGRRSEQLAVAVLDIEADIDSDASWKLPQSVTVDRTVSELVRALGPMLRLARKVVVVEPNFDIGNSAYTAPIAALLREAARQPPALSVIELHMTKRFESMDAYLNTQCRSEVQRLIPTGLTADVCLWDRDIRRDQRAADKLHDRFLLTDFAGVQLGWGFDTRPGSRTTITLLGDELCRQLERDLASNSARFRRATPVPLRFTGTAKL